MNLSWQIPAIVFVAAFIIQLFWQPPCLFKEKSDKLQEYETEAIELEGNCIFLSRENVWAARVGIRTVGQKVIRGVVVYLTAIDGDENAYRDAPLSPSGRLPNITGAINVNPGQTQKFIEILHWKPNVEMGIPYNLNYQLQYGGVNIHKSLYSLPTVIPIGNHTVTIYATGENIKPIEREFEVEIIGNELKMRRTDTNNCIEGEKTALTKKEFHLTAFG